MTWLTGSLLVFVYHYKKTTPDLRFLKQIMTYTMAVLLLVNLLNFDYLIYHYDKASTSAGVDYEYLAGLSTDAHGYKDELTKLVLAIEQSPSLDYKKINPAYTILGNIDMLRFKYGAKKDLNSFNFSEYQEYLNTKDVDVVGYRRRVSEKEMKLSPPVQPINTP
jgi:hypothetical protein